jgi:hypothetical protein
MSSLDNISDEKHLGLTRICSPELPHSAVRSEGSNTGDHIEKDLSVILAVRLAEFD